MKAVYDMSTGRMLTSNLSTERPQRLVSDTTTPELQLQLVVPESIPERTLPPELALADLNAFMKKMS
ncbi:MAG: hypothetical protein KZQ65_07305 [Candidatus Thiodiazotropha sp. (ex Gloverina cf. vestifex)]|nr:hypothetical protein [Candidatus Thiodiazotropha sp. (ex Gloverina cf. vestifex)]